MFDKTKTSNFPDTTISWSRRWAKLFTAVVEFPKTLELIKLFQKNDGMLLLRGEGGGDVGGKWEVSFCRIIVFDLIVCDSAFFLVVPNRWWKPLK